MHSGRTLPTPLVVATVAAAAAAAGALVLRPLRRVEVHGDSMRPALAPGDRLLVVRPAPWRPLAPGDVVAVHDPRRPERLLVKRVVHVGAGGVVVHGDRVEASTDSRTFGPVPRRLVVGRVVHRYRGGGGPQVRSGRWGRTRGTA